ncbi:hypothetical protein K457DRAFT_573072 [Linnemannia elongata AG-77]|uniref:Uncharacterized protein n=1 Tax=Linnemannia elongata AG-77 TaxID=1314771 RepID=A0A197KDT9_9FUNG|nr:hypothetical protein K457DRAFT_573072 [Linnemannia elongata AG-77]
MGTRTGQVSFCQFYPSPLCLDPSQLILSSSPHCPSQQSDSFVIACLLTLLSGLASPLFHPNRRRGGHEPCHQLLPPLDRDLGLETFSHYFRRTKPPQSLSKLLPQSHDLKEKPHRPFSVVVASPEMS